MVIFLTRSLKRLVVLVPGVIITIFAIRDIFPSVHDRLLLILAVLLAYGIVAYGLIPAGLRLWRAMAPPKHPPIYCLTPDGFVSDPINIGLVGDRQALVNAMTAAGWTEADQNSLINRIKTILSIVTNGRYPSAPISRLFMFGRPQDIGFEIQLDERSDDRHHVRFWATDFNPIHPLAQQNTSKDRILPPTDQSVFWIGAVSRDTSRGLLRRNLQLSHRVHLNTDRERDLMVHELSNAKQIKRVDLVRLHEPYQSSIRVWRGYVSTDGVMAVCELSAKPARTEPTVTDKAPSKKLSSALVM